MRAASSFRVYQDEKRNKAPASFDQILSLGLEVDTRHTEERRFNKAKNETQG